MLNIEANKQEYINLLREVNREGADIPALVYKLESSDFFVAPCSTKFHLNVAGGLCKHSINVFNALNDLCEKYAPDIPRDVRIIVALCHDLDKMNKYEQYVKNVKVYSSGGSKSDDLGKFDWKSEFAYTLRDDDKRFVYGHHGQNSEYITNSYIPLNIEESAAISNHMGGLDVNIPDATPIFNRYPLASLLHIADFVATFIFERNE